MCGLSLGAYCHSPCRICWVGIDDCNDPYAIAEKRTVDKMKQLTAPIFRILEDRVPGRVEAARKALVKISAKGVRPFTWEIPFGSTPYGPYGATPPELLHQFDLGLLKTTYGYILKMMKAEATGNIGVSYAERMRIMDQRLICFNVRHCDGDMPRVGFSNGASEITNFRASEFEPLMWQMLIVLGVGTDAALLSIPVKREVVAAVFELLLLRAMIWKPAISELDMPAIEFTIPM